MRADGRAGSDGGAEEAAPAGAVAGVAGAVVGAGEGTEAAGVDIMLDDDPRAKRSGIVSERTTKERARKNVDQCNVGNFDGRQRPRGEREKEKLTRLLWTVNFPRLRGGNLGHGVVVVEQGRVDQTGGWQ